MKTVLIAENNEKDRLLYKEELLNEGYNVITAKNGQGTLKKIHDYSPDLVVMDINMPDMDWVEVVEKISRQHKKIPIIINTAYSPYKENYQSWKVDTYITKSSDSKELREKISELLNKTTLDKATLEGEEFESYCKLQPEPCRFCLCT